MSVLNMWNFNHGRALRSWMQFSITLSNPLIPYSHDSGWISTSAISWNNNPHSRQAAILPLSNYDIQVCISFIIRGITRYSEPILTLQRAFWMRNPHRNFSFMQCFRYRFSHLLRLNALKYSSIAYPNLFFLLCDFDVHQTTPLILMASILHTEITQISWTFFFHKRVWKIFDHFCVIEVFCKAIQSEWIIIKIIIHYKKPKLVWSAEWYLFC